MTFGALTGCANKIGSRLLRFSFRPCEVYKKSGDYEPKCDCDCNKDGAKRCQREPPGELRTNRMSRPRRPGRNTETLSVKRATRHEQADWLSSAALEYISFLPCDLSPCAGSDASLSSGLEESRMHLAMRIEEKAKCHTSVIGWRYL